MLYVHRRRNYSADTAWVLTTNVNYWWGCRYCYDIYATGAGVGISAISIATVNGLQGSSSGGNSPVITLSTTLAAGPLRVTELSVYIASNASWRKFLNLAGNGGTGAVSFTLVVYLEVIMLSVISGFCCRYCCCYRATFVTTQQQLMLQIQLT
jgi:hypothetical protein